MRCAVEQLDERINPAATVASLGAATLYVDATSSPQLSSTYVGYRLTGDGGTYSDVYASIGGFSSGIATGTNAPTVVRLGNITGTNAANAYFYVTPSSTAATPLTYTVTFTSGLPSQGNVIASYVQSITAVEDTIKAAANKFSGGSISGPPTLAIGSEFDVIIHGSTGTIGNPVIAITPATLPGWLASAFQLKSTKIEFTSGDLNGITVNDFLYYSPSPTATSNSDYTETYRFRAIDGTSTSTSLNPVSYIGSGTQVKHTDTGSWATLPTIGPVANNLNVSVTAGAVSGGESTVTLRVQNTGTAAATLDQLLATLGSGLIYVSGSSTLEGAGYSDPTFQGGQPIWSDSFSVSAGGTLTLTFRVSVPATGSYQVSGLAKIGDAQIDTTATTTDNAPSVATISTDTTPPAAPSIAAITQDTGPEGADGITADQTLVLSGAAEAGSTVTLTRVGFGVIGTTTASGLGSWEFDATATTLPEGTYTFTATATDAAGNTSAVSAPFVVVVDITSPTAALDSATDVDSATATNTTTVVITYADAGSGIDPTTLGADDVNIGNGATVTGFSVSGNTVTYTVTAPGQTWQTSPQGAYTIALVAGGVKDLAGNPIASDPAFGSFAVDTVMPTAVLDAAEDVNTAGPANITTVTVSYVGGDIDPATFGVGNITVGNGATVTGFSVSGATVTYTVTAPGVDWAGSFQGVYSIDDVVGSVKDNAGNPVAIDGPLGSFFVDAILPSAVLDSAADIAQAQAAGTTTTVVVTYADAGSGIDLATFDTGDITVGNGATVSGISVSGNTVTYTVTAPGSSWAASPQGSYGIALVAWGVKDLAGNPIAGIASFGSFTVDATAAMATTTSLAIVPNPATFGQPVTLNAAVAGGSGAPIPGGTVVFRDGDTFLAEVALNADGTASFVLPAGLAVGSHSVTASYGGDPVFTPSVSGPSTLVVAKSPAIGGTISASAPLIFFGQEETLTATFTAISDGSTPMTGTVDFFDGDIYLGTAPFVASGPSGLRVASLASSPLAATTSGQARLTTSALALGSHTIRAVYSGDAHYTTATTEVPVSVVVVRATTSIVLTVATSGTSATLTAHVQATSPGQPPLVGNVLFYDGENFVGSAPLVDGVAVLGLDGLAPGSHDFRAAFVGNADGAVSSATVVASVASPAAGADGAPVVGLARFGFHAQPTVLVVSFGGVPVASVASDPSSYVVTGPIGRLRLGRRIVVRTATYDRATNTVTLTFNRRLNLHRSYRIAIPKIGYSARFGGEILAGRSR